MTKREIYDVLKEDGAKLKAFNTMLLETLTALYTERFGKSPEEAAPPTVETQKSGQSEEKKVQAETKNKSGEKKKADPDPVPARFPLLHFRNSGWCEALQRSYFRGNYRPATKEEYEALKPFAASDR